MNLAIRNHSLITYLSGLEDLIALPMNMQPLPTVAIPHDTSTLSKSTFHCRFSCLLLFVSSTFSYGDHKLQKEGFCSAVSLFEKAFNCNIKPPISLLFSVAKIIFHFTAPAWTKV